MARVLISMPEDFLSKIDDLADKEQRTRSELIREALRTYIHKVRIRERDVTSDSQNATLLESIL